ncbi:hypothetical protein [Rubritalea tangerina]|uniref:hypothetical protein n=1 Tax=Rubritalea tangerina TaxID=430798 RepID=UPI003610F122
MLRDSLVSPDRALSRRYVGQSSACEDTTRCDSGEKCVRKFHSRGVLECKNGSLSGVLEWDEGDGGFDPPTAGTPTAAL